MFSLIFLSGGTGSRVGGSTPKQYLPLGSKPIALHSFDIFLKIPDILELVVVCSPEYQSVFSNRSERPLQFAPPGTRRQDSVYSGLEKSTQEFVLIHDSARPFPDPESVFELIRVVRTAKAAALASPVTSTVKQCGAERIVEKTFDRSFLWEMQTPQAVERNLLLKAHAHLSKMQLEITDDLGAVEAIGHPTQIVPSSPKNFKITTPFDLEIARHLCAIN